MNANEDQLETLQSILDAVKEIGEDADASPYQNLAVSCVQVLRALVVLANESDPNGVYGETLEGIIEDYNRVNDAVETADAQSANALFTAMKVTSLVVKECCASQEQIDQIDEGLAQFDAENEAAADVNEQTVVCARWLRRMLGAFAKLNNAGCAGDIDAQRERTEDVITSGDLNLEQKTVQYLASSVYALAIFTGDMTME